MKSLRMIFLLVTGSMLFTGCFSMLEEVHHNSKTGDGTYKFVMDLSGMKPMLEMAAAMDTTGSMSLDTLDQFSKDFVNKIDGLSGISNITPIKDIENFKFGVEFSYKNLASLNVAIGQLFDDGQLSSGGNEVFFAGKKKRFERMDARGFNSLVDELTGAAGGGEDGEMEMAMMFLKDVSYTMVYHFDKKVKKVSNDLAAVSNDKKTVTMKYFLFDESRGGTNGTIENKIKLKGGWFW